MEGSRGCAPGQRPGLRSTQVRSWALPGLLLGMLTAGGIPTSGQIPDDTVPDITNPPPEATDGLPAQAAELHRRVGGLLDRYAELDDLRDVRVRMAGDTIRLSGLALGEEARVRAEELALDLEGVVAVENGVRVVERVPWDEDEPLDEDRTVSPADAPPEEESPGTGRALLLSALVLGAVVLAGVIVFARMRRFRRML